MTAADLQLIVAALAGIALSIMLIVKARLHPFVGLLCGAFAVGLLAGLPIAATAGAVQKGAGDILGGTGLVVALGLALGAMLQLSDGAAGIARTALRWSGAKGAPWAALLTGLVIGLPLFFETGLVLLLPIVASAAAALPGAGDSAKLRLMLSAVTGLSVVHALVPPHPGPLLAVEALGADLGLTILYGLIVAVPTAILAGPLLARFTARGVRLGAPTLAPARVEVPAPPVWRALLVVLLPVALIAAGQLPALLPPAAAPQVAWLAAASNPVLALLLACLAALPLLFGRAALRAPVQSAIWAETVAPAGAILLAIGAGGALKQVLVTAGLSDLLVRVSTGAALSPLLLAWGIAVCIRLATGSATVATITTAGMMPGVVAATGASPEWVVLAIGAGSVFFSHVNDPGFWLVKSYLGTDTPGTFRTWSALETAISVIGLLLVLLASTVLS
ncbi:gluconate:H+ symporter [Sphingomonas mucosissima]|uniref:Gnt-II system L-idonate transporter n=1 Tax=Sphingomonas mucosissima TaxID=370959 RepID=A0A245ZL94_9SPHN|nr:gluconate:H+ symporter [Sphingomonas mucosissima]OWK30505.1 Gnt-II system L-idonate transporter [Sphingomonas mucosissima]